MLNNLHNHNFYSIRDAVSSPEQMAKRARELGQNAIAITNHGGCSSFLRFQKACEKEGVKSILGYELYESNKIEPIKYNHLTLLAKTDKGVMDLIKINNLGVLGSNYKNRRGQYVPIVSVDEIKENGFGKDIVVLTGCSSSPLLQFMFTDNKAAYKCKDIEECKKLLNPSWKEPTKKYIEKLIETFDSVYVELQYHGLPIQILSTPLLREIASEMGLKCVPTCDSHYAKQEDREIQQMIFDADPSKGKSSAYNHSWIKSESEMLEHFTQEEIDNTVEVSDLCNGKLYTSSPIIPKTKRNINLKDLCYNSERWKLVPKTQIEIYKKRLEYELDVIYKYKLDGYLEVICDICMYADENNIFRGDARGSGAGSLVCWLSCITGKDVDPIKYKLMFERFINAGRFSEDRNKTPDLDLDFDTEGRENIINSIRKQYGEDNVCAVSNFNELSTKSSLRTYARSTNNYDDIDYLANISERFKSLSQMMNDDIYKTLNKDQRQFIEKASRLDGIISNNSTHASGIVIIENLKEKIPLRRDSESGNIIADLDKDDVESLGGVKIDILGLAQLTKIKYMLEAIEQGKDNKKIYKNPKQYVHEDPLSDIDPQYKKKENVTLKENKDEIMPKEFNKGDAFEDIPIIEKWVNHMSGIGFDVKEIVKPSNIKMQEAFYDYDWVLPEIGFTHIVSREGKSFLCDVFVDYNFDSKIFKLALLKNKTPVGCMGVADTIIYLIDETSECVSIQPNKFKEILTEIDVKYLRGNTENQQYEIPEEIMTNLLKKCGAKRYKLNE